MRTPFNSLTIGFVIGILFLFAVPWATWGMPPNEGLENYRTEMAGGDDNTISGRIREDGIDVPNITVKLALNSNPNTPIQTVTTGGDGIYTFTNVSNGVYTIRPEDPAYNFDPPSREVTVFFGNVSNQNFNAIFREYDVIGKVVDNSVGLPNIIMRLYQLPNITTPIQSVVTNNQGDYLFANVVPGNYRVTPDDTDYTFVPDFREFSVENSPVALSDFEANPMVPTSTPTHTPTRTITPTITNTPPPGATFTPTSTATPSPTNTPPSGATFTPTSTATPSVLPEAVHVPLVLNRLAFATPAPTPTPAPTCLTVDDEPNNFYLEADSNLPLCQSATVNGYVSRTSDVNDIYRIEVEGSAGTIQISLTNLPTGADYDLYLDAGPGNNLAFSTNAGSVNETITFTLAPGRYYIRVVARVDGNPNGYQLRWIRQ